MNERTNKRTNERKRRGMEEQLYLFDEEFV
jgi:hypothetical protein